MFGPGLITVSMFAAIKIIFFRSICRLIIQYVIISHSLETGTEFEKEQSKKEPKNPNYPCAALDISVEGLAPVSCGHQGFGFICEMPSRRILPYK